MSHLPYLVLSLFICRYKIYENLILSYRCPRLLDRLTQQRETISIVHTYVRANETFFERLLAPEEPPFARRVI